MKVINRILLAAAVLAAPSQLAAQSEGCVPEFIRTAQTVSINDITVGAGASANETFQLRMRNAGSESSQCQATLRVARLSTSTSSGQIPYSLRARGRNLQILPNETFPGTAASDLIIQQLVQGSNGSAFPIRLTVPSGWGLAEGRQVDDLIVFLLNRSGEVTDTLRLTIALNVPPSVEVRVVGATGRRAIASVNLGTLDPTKVNVSNPFGIRVWSTSPYTVSYKSENDGQLVHTNAASRIRYQLIMNGNRVSVMGLPAAHVPDGTDRLGDFHPLRVRVRPFRATAGAYSDRVEVTVTAN